MIKSGEDRPARLSFGDESFVGRLTAHHVREPVECGEVIEDLGDGIPRLQARLKLEE